MPSLTSLKCILTSHPPPKSRDFGGGSRFFELKFLFFDSIVQNFFWRDPFIKDTFSKNIEEFGHVLEPKFNFYKRTFLQKMAKIAILG